MMRIRLVHGALFLAAVLAATSSARSGVTVGVDVATLNALLPALGPTEVVVPLSEAGQLTIEVRDLKVTGLEPGAGGTGQILTSLTLFVREAGIEIALAPRLALDVVDEGRVLELRFVEARMALPLAGSLDIARFMQPLRFPATSVFLLDGADGEVRVTSRLQEIRMGAKVIQFEIDLEPSREAP